MLPTMTIRYWPSSVDDCWFTHLARDVGKLCHVQLILLLRLFVEESSMPRTICIAWYAVMISPLQDRIPEISEVKTGNWPRFVYLMKPDILFDGFATYQCGNQTSLVVKAWTTPSQCWISIRIAAGYGSWTSRVTIQEMLHRHTSVVFHCVLFPKEERGILLCCEEE
ncbi:hypothetical protein Droror1_Dr00018446 [Drosera rotundifolia]